MNGTNLLNSYAEEMGNVVRDTEQDNNVPVLIAYWHTVFKSKHEYLRNESSTENTGVI